ncbi:hypothetical protein QFZ94_007731 [Paraburkholderia sp. JPY465]|uniref:hypothetical protein n=1 Tax=Paraburkholderia sp. JPY465 TaxID=3042285 RepID=UPI003D2084DE
MFRQSIQCQFEALRLRPKFDLVAYRVTGRRHAAAVVDEGGQTEHRGLDSDERRILGSQRWLDDRVGKSKGKNISRAQCCEFRRVVCKSVYSGTQVAWPRGLLTRIDDTTAATPSQGFPSSSTSKLVLLSSS